MINEEVRPGIRCVIANQEKKLGYMLPFETQIMIYDDKLENIVYCITRDNILVDEIIEEERLKIGRIAVEILNISDDLVEVKPKSSYPENLSIYVRREKLTCYCQLYNCSRCGFAKQKNDPIPLSSSLNLRGW